MLTGPRRTGKTSLAEQTLRHLKSRGYYTAAVDCFAVRDKQHLAQKIVEGCLANRTGLPKTLATIKEKMRSFAPIPLSVKVQDLDLEIGLFLNHKASPDELLEHALEFPQRLAEKDNKRMIFLYDEFQDVSVVAGESIFKRMRAAFQKQNRVNYLFLGSKKSLMNTLFSSRREAFYRFAVPLPVPAVPTESWLHERGNLQACHRQSTLQCVFRTETATDSGVIRPPIPIFPGHLFRTRPATYSVF